MEDSLIRIFQCIVCFEIPDDGLRCLPCGHSICGKCIRTISPRQCPICRHPLPANLNEVPVNYQLMSARDEMTTILGKLSRMEDSFTQLNLNMENTIQEMVEKTIAIERAQFRQKIRKVIAEEQKVEETLAVERVRYSQHIDKLLVERRKVEEAMGIERMQFSQRIDKLMAEGQKVEEAMAVDRAQFRRDIDKQMAERQKVEKAMAVERVQSKHHIDKLMAEINRLHEVVNSKEQELKNSNAVQQQMQHHAFEADLVKSIYMIVSLLLGLMGAAILVRFHSLL